MSELASSASPRLRSLDAFRGMVIALMFFVNLSWDRSAFPDWIGHAGWNNGKQGIWLADFVFPWFLFIVGVAIPFSMQSGRGRGMTASQRLLAAARRCAILYFLGCLIGAARNAYNPVKPLTFSWLISWDILQHIGFAYLVAVMVMMLPRWSRIGFVAMVLVGKWIWMMFIPVPGTEQILWTQDQSTYRWLNSQVGWFGGFQNVLPGACTVLLGCFAGEELRNTSLSARQRALRLAIGGGIAAAIAMLWQLHFPFSKDYYTSTYALLTAGTGAMVLAAFYWLIDGSDGLAKRPLIFAFESLGLNAIAIYFGGEFLWATVLGRWQILYPNGMAGAFIGGVQAWLQHLCGNIPGAWAFVLGYIAFWWIVATLLMRHRVFFKV
jgi:predicted acyltransferase